MNFNTIAFSILITLLLSLSGTCYYLFSKNANLQREISLQKYNNANLQTSIDKQNSEINILKAREYSLRERFNEVESKYENIKNKSNTINYEQVIKDYAQKHNISNKDAFCRIQMDTIEKGLDEFYKK